MTKPNRIIDGPLGGGVFYFRGETLPKSVVVDVYRQQPGLGKSEDHQYVRVDRDGVPQWHHARKVEP
jgi:hypothetical protein